MSPRGAVVCAIALLLAGSAAAGSQVLPAERPGGDFPALTARDDGGQTGPLRTWLQQAGSGPVLVLPVYARCTLSCPVLARQLATAAGKIDGPFRVLLFSFDPGDDALALADFRRREGLPASWLVTGAEAGEIRRFSDFFNYRVLTEGTVMQHPDELFVLDDQLRWRATLAGDGWNAAALGETMRRAESRSPLTRTDMDPERMAWIGFGAVVLGFAFVGYRLAARRLGA